MKMRKLLALILLGFIVHQSCEAMDQNRKKKNKHHARKQSNNPIDVQENKHRGHKQINNNPIDIQDNSGETALIRACKAGNVEEVKRCLNQNADENIKDMHGKGALYYACNSKEGSADTIVKLLLEKGFNPNITETSFERTPLHTACSGGFSERVKLLLHYGANPNIQDAQGNDALFFAGNNPEIVLLLLNAGANPSQNIIGNTALHIACANDHIEVIKMFLQSRSPQEIIKLINVRNKNKISPLMIAKDPSHKEILKLLENFTKNPPKNPVIVKRRDNIPLENLKISENLKIDENNDEEVDECSICLEPFKTTLECGHSFHPKCIDNWLKQNPKNPTCPLCRRPVQVNNNNNNINK